MGTTIMGYYTIKDGKAVHVKPKTKPKPKEEASPSEQANEERRDHSA